VAAVAAAGFVLVFGVTLAVSAARGGRGAPDLRLLVDGALAVTLAGWVGLLLGMRLGSVVPALLVGPLWVVFSMMLFPVRQIGGLSTWSVEWLSPLVTADNRSAALGFVPDVLWPHLAWLAGLLVVLSSALVVLVHRDARAGWPLKAVGVGLAGLLVALPAGAALGGLPDAYVIHSAERSTWVPLHSQSLLLYGDDGRFDSSGRLPDPFTYPDDGKATTCARGRRLQACVYPAYGARMARRLVGALDPAAELLHGLPGVPSSVRMVATTGTHCRGSELLFDKLYPRDQYFWRNDAEAWLQPVKDLVACATDYEGYVDPHPVVINHPDGSSEIRSTRDYARDVVFLWVLTELGKDTSGFMPPNDPEDRAALDAAHAMARLPTEDVRRGLAAVWDRLRAGGLPLGELPGVAR
jgi:hypothetical protein